MKRLLSVAIAVGCFCAVSSWTSTAKAQFSSFPWPYLSPTWSIYVRDYIPYFAAHPPVYYSYPVPRPYGYSPYAYPPGIMTPELKQSDLQVMQQNPHVPQESIPADTPAEPANRQARALRITNPYVVVDHQTRP